jgi:hypothetical protein
MDDLNEPDSKDHSQRWSFISWPLILVIAFLIFEVTNDPAFAALAMCLKFGWEDFRTARWLRKTDPDRGRGKACFWLYVAAGLWQTAVIGVAMVLLTVVVQAIVQGNGQGQAAFGLISLLAGALAAIVFGFILSTVATGIALLCAKKYRIRPWLNGAVHFARRRGEWPPFGGQSNRVMMVVVSAAVVLCCLLMPVGLWIATEALRQAFPPRILRQFASIGAVLCFIVVLPAALLFVFDLRRRGFFARHPADCWGEEPLPVVENDAHGEETV